MRNKKYILMSISLLLITVILFSGQGLWAAEKKVYINGIDPDCPPFTYMDEKGNPTGFDVECLNWIAQEMGFEVKQQPTAWDGIVPSLLAKKIDMIYSAMSITEERKKKIGFTDIVWEVKNSVCVRKDSDLNIITALSGDYMVGLQKGSTQKIWIEDNLVKPGILGEDNVRYYESTSMAVKDLVNGRIDSFFHEESLLKNAIRKGRPIRIVGTIEDKTPDIYGIGIRKEDKELKALLNEGIARLKKSPKRDELIIKYFSE